MPQDASSSHIEESFRRLVALRPELADERRHAEGVSASVVGCTEGVGRCMVESSGRVYRIAIRDGIHEALTADLQWTRVNVTIVDGVVTAADLG